MGKGKGENRKGPGNGDRLTCETVSSAGLHERKERHINGRNVSRKTVGKMGTPGGVLRLRTISSGDNADRNEKGKDQNYRSASPYFRKIGGKQFIKTVHSRRPRSIRRRETLLKIRMGKG